MRIAKARYLKIRVSFATSSGRGFECRYRSVVVSFEWPIMSMTATRSNCWIAGCQGVSQIVEATHSDAGLFLGTDEAAADGGAIERGAVRSAEDMVGVAREPRPLPQSL
jgi:hypothetical protein